MKIPALRECAPHTHWAGNGGRASCARRPPQRHPRAKGTNDLIRQALFPYATNLVLVTKIGAWRDDKGGWNLDRSADFLRQSVQDNLKRLGLDQMAIVNLRMGGPADDIAAPMQVMRQMQDAAVGDEGAA